MTIDVQKLEAIDVELKAYAEVLSHVADERTREAMMAHIDALLDDRARAMGLPEDEIARINQEAEAAVEEQIEGEIAIAVDTIQRAAITKPLPEEVRRLLDAARQRLRKPRREP